MTMKRSAPPLVEVERVSTLSLEVTETPVSITERSCIAESQVVYAPLSFHSSAQGEVSLPDSLRACHKRGKHFGYIAALRRYQVHFRVFVIVSLCFVFHQRGEHRAVTHVVPIDDRVVVGKIPRVFIVDEQTATLFAVLSYRCFR